MALLAPFRRATNCPWRALNDVALRPVLAGGRSFLPCSQLPNRPPGAAVAPRCCSSSSDSAARLAAARPDAYTKHTHPREWAIFRKIDKDHNGSITRDEFAGMCQNFDAIESADVLVRILDSSKDGKVTFQDFCDKFYLVAMVRKAARLKQWHRCYGLGVAGNVAGHMAQAGEGAAEPESGGDGPPTPANIFTFYAPHPHTVDAPEGEILERLETFPVTNAVIDFPKIGGKVQVEPEMGLYCDIVYSVDNLSVERLVPRRIAAFNDCSIRQLDGSEKLSERKNWGFGSKGISLRSFRIDSMSPGTLVDQLILTSYVKRSDKVERYSVSAPARNYLMFHEPLVDWIIERINNQQNTGAWEEIFSQLVASDYPTSMWIALGAGEYTEWGQSNFLQPQDECVVIIYDEKLFPEGPGEDVVGSLFEDYAAPEGVVALHQTFV